jgi:hypothetical protein
MVFMTEPRKRGRPRVDKSKTADRHVDRRTVSFTTAMYRALGELAKREGRPVAWQGRMIIQKALEEAGLWPPPSGEKE